MVGHPCEPFPTMELRDRAAEADWALHYGNTREIMDALARLEEDFDREFCNNCGISLLADLARV